MGRRLPSVVVHLPSVVRRQREAVRIAERAAVDPEAVARQGQRRQQREANGDLPAVDRAGEGRRKEAHLRQRKVALLASRDGRIVRDAADPLLDSFGPLQQPFCFRRLPLLQQQLRQGAQDSRRLYSVGRDVVDDRQRRPEELEGGAGIPSLVCQHSQIV